MKPGIKRRCVGAEVNNYPVTPMKMNFFANTLRVLCSFRTGAVLSGLFPVPNPRRFRLGQLADPVQSIEEAQT